MSEELPFYVERRDREDGGIAYDVWQRDAPPYRNKKGLLVTPNEERHIAEFTEKDFPRDAKVMADRVALGLNITTDIKP